LSIHQYFNHEDDETDYVKDSYLIIELFLDGYGLNIIKEKSDHGQNSDEKLEI